VNNKPTYISREGLEKLRHELEEMVSVRRPEIAQRIHDAKEHGDLTENAEYEDAKNEQAFVEGRIQTLEALIKNATLIDEHHSIEMVQIGSTVKVDGPDGKTVYYVAKGPDGSSIRAVPVTGGASRLLVRFDDPTRQHTRFGFSTDGRTFYCTIGALESDIWVAQLETR